LTSVFNRCSIIDIAGRNFKSQKLTDLIDDQMKLESKQPSQTGFSSAGQTLKDFISGDWNVLANGYRTRVNLAEACYLSSTGLKIG
jgi:hypothetical protein